MFHLLIYILCLVIHFLIQHPDGHEKTKPTTLMEKSKRFFIFKVERKIVRTQNHVNGNSIPVDPKESPSIETLGVMQCTPKFHFLAGELHPSSTNTHV